MFRDCKNSVPQDPGRISIYAMLPEGESANQVKKMNRKARPVVGNRPGEQQREPRWTGLCHQVYQQLCDNG